MTDDSDEITTMRLKIEGAVQGVGFRDFAIEQANARRLTGWIRNRGDGSVEALASGPTKKVEEFIAACMQGPALARVSNIDLSPAEPPERMGFTRRPSL
jgi:acylphosphatase